MNNYLKQFEMVDKLFGDCLVRYKEPVEVEKEAPVDGAEDLEEEVVEKVDPFEFVDDSLPDYANAYSVTYSTVGPVDFKSSFKCPFD